MLIEPGPVVPAHVPWTLEDDTPGANRYRKDLGRRRHSFVYQFLAFVDADGRGCRWVWRWEVREAGRLAALGTARNSLEAQSLADAHTLESWGTA